MKSIFLAISAVGILAACSNSSNSIEVKESKVRSNYSAQNISDEELNKKMKEIQEAEAKKQEEEKRNQTTLKFDKLTHEFGDVASGSENTTNFLVTNTGDVPLVISDVSASCGCTLPKKPEGPIQPGESDEIQVTFKPKPSQKNLITKTVTVTANTAEKIHKLEISAFVK